MRLHSLDTHHAQDQEPGNYCGHTYNLTMPDKDRPLDPSVALRFIQLRENGTENGSCH
jgi:hypothetical protein